MAGPPDLESRLRERLEGGGRVFVPYVTGGFPGVDAGLLRGLEEAGADAIEIGIPFSDPVMDGPVIQEASRRALEAGATPGSIAAMVRSANLTIPVLFMTYLNPVLALGYERFGELAAEVVSGVIVPDLPVDEAGPWLSAAPAGLSTVFLAAPGTSRARLEQVGAVSRGFVYCVSTYGVTGERQELSDTARELVEELRPLTETPLLVGVGIGTPEAAARVCEFADGVVVGSALVRPLLEGDPAATLELSRALRSAVA